MWTLHYKRSHGDVQEQRLPSPPHPGQVVILPLSFSGIREEGRGGGCLQWHRTCLTSHELHTPTHGVSCHTQALPPTGFTFHRGKPHQTPAPAWCRAILERGKCRAEGDFTPFNTSGESGSEIPCPVWNGAFYELERRPRKAETADKETQRELTWFHLGRRSSSSIAISKQLRNENARYHKTVQSSNTEKHAAAGKSKPGKFYLKITEIFTYA